MIELYKGDCLKVIGELVENGVKVDAVITSPPYNTSRKGRSDPYNKRYNTYADFMNDDEYILWQVAFFKNIDKILNKNGIILYNSNYGGEKTETLWILLSRIITETEFTIVDQIIWKKKNSLPNNTSRCALTRICENIFVICRKTEKKTFISNKRIISVSNKNQNFYENIFNLIEAKNNDRGYWTKKHKATYSIELCEKLLNIYVPNYNIVFDPFMGSGTTAVACVNTNRNFIGIELDKNYFEISKERINKAKEEKIMKEFMEI